MRGIKSKERIKLINQVLSLEENSMLLYCGELGVNQALLVIRRVIGIGIKVDRVIVWTWIRQSLKYQRMERWFSTICVMDQELARLGLLRFVSLMGWMCHSRNQMMKESPLIREWCWNQVIVSDSVEFHLKIINIHYFCYQRLPGLCPSPSATYLGSCRIIW